MTAWSSGGGRRRDSTVRSASSCRSRPPAHGPTAWAHYPPGPCCRWRSSRTRWARANAGWPTMRSSRSGRTYSSSGCERDVWRPAGPHDGLIRLVLTYKVYGSLALWAGSCARRLTAALATGRRAADGERPRPRCSALSERWPAGMGRRFSLRATSCYAPAARPPCFRPPSRLRKCRRLNDGTARGGSADGCRRRAWTATTY